MLATDAEEPRNFLMSIHPEYAGQIVAGKKTVELRRRFIETPTATSRLFIYSTKPVGAVIGCATIAAVQKLTVPQIWKKFGKAACISKADFDRYFFKREVGYAIHLGTVTRFCTPVLAERLRQRFGFSPPQSFIYVREELARLLEHERQKALT